MYYLLQTQESNQTVYSLQGPNCKTNKAFGHLLIEVRRLIQQAQDMIFKLSSSFSLRTRSQHIWVLQQTAWENCCPALSRLKVHFPFSLRSSFSLAQSPAFFNINALFYQEAVQQWATSNPYNAHLENLLSTTFCIHLLINLPIVTIIPQLLFNALTQMFTCTSNTANPSIPFEPGTWQAAWENAK